MKFQLEMPRVTGCAVRDCAYNVDQDCHARAITVGDGAVLAMCDTYLSAHDHTGTPQVAGVGACKSTTCKHNQDFECQAAPGIEVGLTSGHPVCTTFDPQR